MAKDTYKHYAKALLAVMRGASPSDVAGLAHQFVALLARKQKLKQAGRIFDEYVRLSKKEAGIVGLTITSAHELEGKTLEKIKNVFGKTVEEKVVLDANLLAGVTVRSDDTIFDASFKTQLLNLKNKLLA